VTRKTDLHWMTEEELDQAQCKGQQERMFPQSGRAVAAAKELCNGCPVIESCYKEAIQFDDSGIRAGLSQRDRRKIRRREKR